MAMPTHRRQLGVRFPDAFILVVATELGVAQAIGLRERRQHMATFDWQVFLRDTGGNAWTELFQAAAKAIRPRRELSREPWLKGARS